MYLLPKKINQFSETIFDSDKNFGIGAVVKTPTDIMVEGGGGGEGGKPSLRITQTYWFSVIEPIITIICILMKEASGYC